LTVPFALAAGRTGAVTSARIVIVAGFAESPPEHRDGPRRISSPRETMQKHYEIERRREERK